jgi:hypothetical protein
LLLLAVAALARPPAPTEWRPPLVTDEPAGESRGAPALAALAMSSDERRRLDDALADFGARLDARAHPLANDFGDDDPDAALRPPLRSALPKLTAARSLLAVRASEHRSGVDPWARGGDGESRRARFLAWPLAAAALIACDDDAALGAVARRLRARAAAADSRIAIVMGDGDVDVRQLLSLRAQAAALARRLPPSDERTLLDEIGAAGAPSLPSWLQLPPRRLLVVPRLGSLAALDAFAAEIAAAAPGARLIHRPLPLD